MGRSAVICFGILAVLAGCSSHRLQIASSVQETYIVLVPLGNVPKADLETARRGVARMFRANVKVIRSRPLPAIAYYQPRDRYRADKILDPLELVSGGVRTIAITAADISTTKDKCFDWGVCGLGSLEDKVCVISTFRLGKYKVPDFVLRNRIERLAQHELGHTFGLPHCPRKHCLMADAFGAVKSLDEGKGFCEACRRKLASALN